MALVEWLLPSMWVEPPTSSRWMAAQQLSIVLVKAQSGKYKHDDHNDQRQNLVIRHYVHLLCTGCTKRRREAWRHLAALPCGKAALPAGGDPHGHFNMRKTILSTATALRRPPFCLPEQMEHRKSARKSAFLGACNVREGRETGTAAEVVALRASRQGRCKRQNRRASAKGTVSRGGRRLAPLRPAAHGQQFRGAVFLVHVALVQHVQRSRQGGGP